MSTTIETELPIDKISLNSKKITPAADSTNSNPKIEREEDDEVNPWNVVSKADTGIDYDKLIKRFGCSALDQALKDRLEKLAKRKLHRFIRRDIFFSHRDLHEILNCVEKGTPFFLYTGRGPSSGSLHMGHLIQFTITKWLQEVFDVPLVIQMTDDEKFLWKGLSIEETQKMTIENAKDILALGFDVNKTFIFSDFNFIG